ncbi:membrane protein insertion efficiency factor YidD [Schaalia sp. ZJ405]|nr:membrane protein insertion efficiency factor YidD [Schaalia sp. ZJ405]
MGEVGATMMILPFVRRVLRTTAIAPIRAYQRWVSPLLGPRCRYAPTCSAYAVEAISVHGVIKGIILATWRLLRCNPWSLGGVDHVPDRGRWRPDPWIAPDDWAGNADDIEYPVPMGLVEESSSVLVPLNSPKLPVQAGQPQGATSAQPF